MDLRLPIILAGIALLSGCATMDEGECRTADWYQQGMRDGLDGAEASRLHEHREACAKYGIQPLEQRYLDGRSEGLRQYCRLDNAVQMGLKGKQYEGVCPPSVDRAFRRHNEAAYEIHRLRNEVDNAGKALDDKEKRLRDKKLTDEQRADLRQDIRDLDRKVERLRDDLRSRERELDRLVNESRSRGLWR